MRFLTVRIRCIYKCEACMLDANKNVNNMLVWYTRDIMREQASRYSSPVATETLRMSPPDSKYFDDKPTIKILLGDPLYTRDVMSSQSLGIDKPTKSPVYAVFSTVSENPVRSYLIGEEGEEQLPPQQRRYVLLRDVEENGDKLIYQKSRELRGDNYAGIKDFNMHLFRNGSSLVLKPGDSEIPLDVTVSPHGQEDIQDPLTQFPSNKQFKVHFHKGSYSLRDQERFEEELSDQVKRAWVKMADGFGFERNDFNDFPVKDIHFWPKTREGEELYGISKLREWKDKFYGLRRLPAAFTHEGVSGASSKITRKIHMPVSRGGEFDEKSLMHELTHQYLYKQGIYLGGFRSLIAEGVADAAALLVDGSIRTPGDNKFSSFEDLMREGKLRDIPAGHSNLYFYDNAVLHLYLLKERGGFAKIKEMASSSSSVGLDREGLLGLYESTYGESLFDLLEKAKTWSPQYLKTR